MARRPTRTWLDAACEAVPLFPLPDVVFLPHTMLPLHVFEPRYRALVAHAQEGNRLVAVPRLAPGWQDDYEGRPALLEVAGLGRIVQQEPLSDGRSNILLVGIARVRVEDEPTSPHPYRVARCSVLEDAPPAGGQPALQRATALLRAQLGALVSQKPRLATLLGPALQGDPDLWVPLAAHVLLTHADARQAWLELDEPVERIERIVAVAAEKLAGASWG